MIVKPLQEGKVAVVYFNRHPTAYQVIEFNLAKIKQFEGQIGFKFEEIWTGSNGKTQMLLRSDEIEPQGTRTYIVWKE